MVPVLAAVMQRGDTYLVCQRPSHKRHGGLWEFPGGKLEAGESWLEAAVRELAEELNVHVESVGEPVFAMSDPGSLFVITFVPVKATGEPTALEHETVQWLTAEELLSLNLAPSDRAFAEWLNA